MEFYELLAVLEETVFPAIIRKVVELSDCYVVCCCGPDGLYLPQMPFKVTKDGNVSFYNLKDEGEHKRYKEGTVVYTDDNEFQSDSSEENLGSVGILVVKDGKFLCGTRHNDFGYGLMCGPGGHIEKGESPEYAAIREADEEFSIIPTELISLGTGPTEPDTGLTPHLFLCTEYEGEPASGDLEITNIKFRSLDELENVDMFQPFIDGIYQFLDSLVEEFDEKLSSETNISEKPIDKSPDSAIIKSKTNSDGGKGSGNHGHKGIPGQVGGSAPTEQEKNGETVSSSKTVLTRYKTVDGTITIGSTPLPLKSGKKGKKTAFLPPKGKIEDVHNFAGKGCAKPFVKSGTIAKQEGGKPEDWYHKEGIAFVSFTNGSSEMRPVHWFENEHIGQFGWKIKAEIDADEYYDRRKKEKGES